MRELRCCPVCGGTDFRTVGTCHSRQSEKPKNLIDGGCNAILQSVIKAVECVQDTKWCSHCTHVFLSPTYDEVEITRLYSDKTSQAIKGAFRHVEAETGTNWKEFHGMSSTDHQRRLVKSKLNRPADLRRFIESVDSRFSDVSTFSMWVEWTVIC